MSKTSDGNGRPISFMKNGESAPALFLFNKMDKILLVKGWIRCRFNQMTKTSDGNESNRWMLSEPSEPCRYRLGKMNVDTKKERHIILRDEK